MDRSDVIHLIEYNLQPNSFGNYEAVDIVEPLTEFELGIDEDTPIPFSERLPWRATEVFCDVRSITQTEWFDAGRNGIQHPEYVFVMNRNEYGGQKIVQYNGQLYGVFRTYEAKNENLELHCEAKGGLHDGTA